MSLALIVSAILTLGTTSNVNAAASNGIGNRLLPQFSLISLGENVGTQNQKVPFTIDGSEIEGATVISMGLFGEEIPLNGVILGNFVLSDGLSADNPVIIVDLSGPERGLVAEDVLVWGQKETLVFNAGNTARAEVILGLLDFGAAGSQLSGAYGKIGNHPEFGQLKQLIMKERGWPENEILLERIADLTVKIAVDILRTP